MGKKPKKTTKKKTGLELGNLMDKGESFYTAEDKKRGLV
jgi:hypothetical protein